MTRAKRRILLSMAVTAFILLAPLIILYSLGYRLSPHFTLTKTGGLYISSPKTGSEIFINNRLKKRTNLLQSGLFVQNLKPASYAVVVAREEFWPWTKDIEVKEQFVTEARAFLLPKDPEGRVILRGKFLSIQASPEQKVLLLEEQKKDDIEIIAYSPRTDTFLTDIDTADIPELNDIGTSTEPNSRADPESKYVRFSKGERERIWWNPETNEIWAEWLGSEDWLPYYFQQKKMLIWRSESPIRNIEFFPKRRDVIIAAFENGVFAIEIDGRGKRNIQPIYKGHKPNFALFPGEEKIYVLDDGILFEIKL